MVVPRVMLPFIVWGDLDGVVALWTHSVVRSVEAVVLLRLCAGCSVSAVPQAYSCAVSSKR